MTPLHSAEARNRLLTRRAELERASELSLKTRRPVELDQQSVGRLSRVDAMQHQALAQAAERKRVVELQRIDAALLRLERGEYGECVGCGEEIAAARLELDPAATSCIACAREAATR
ncbi:transcriptional regulator, TraR/DksA family [Nannocystis exedens]|uniref:Transcriptional regulator, TraR/DksA family n=2 Tax=Nannocystis exedens TaxID=54 RepID=A0A1I2HSM6_9BACT|nr:molecular chaperone DnaK [Nannocystis exedens]SFF31857.1 transcriptional regulator, TraR/DksA family [Nannocystis exedens]